MNKNVLFFFNLNKKTKFLNRKILNQKNKKKTINNSPIKMLKVKVLGNFFKLKIKNNKKLIKFNLCLAHKIYLFRYLNFWQYTIKKIKKNKIAFIQKNINNLNNLNQKNINTFFFLKKKRNLNSYTKKGIRFNLDCFKFKTGKKTTY